MKRIYLFFYFLLVCFTFVSAQQKEENKFSLSVDLGAGQLFANSNLSPYGVYSRDAYSSGFSGNIKAAYRPDKTWQVGLKYNFFMASPNYELQSGAAVADDTELHYIAPQVGLMRELSDRFALEYMVGVGYMHYRCKSLNNSVENNYKKGFLAANMDCTLSYRVYQNTYIGVGASLMGGQTSSLKEKTSGKWQNVDRDDWNRIKVLRADFFLSFRVLM